MVAPDLLQICEIMLFSEGFAEAKVLAKKMTVLYRLAREQLSKQHHYDFGLRALKSVLVMAGSLKRENATTPEGTHRLSYLALFVKCNCCGICRQSSHACIARYEFAQICL